MKPKYCPNCGRGLTDIQLFQFDDGYYGYDCYCNNCEWSGDINPDNKLIED